jgi:hypothetical protein
MGDVGFMRELVLISGERRGEAGRCLDGRRSVQTEGPGLITGDSV